MFLCKKKRNYRCDFIDYQINEKNEVLYENEKVIIKGSNFYNKDHNAIFYNTSTFLHSFPDTNKDLLWTLEPVSVMPANFSMDILKYFPALFNWNRKLLDKLNHGVYLPHQIYKKESDFCNYNSILNGFNSRKREILFISNIKKSMHDSGLYQIRLDAADWFYSNSEFEVSWYGSKELNRPYYKGKVENKTERITQSQFLFCPENCYDEYYSWDYLTEKLFDGFVGQAIPIYAGCYNIDSYLPEDLYVDLRKYNNSVNGYLEVDFKKLYETLCFFDNNRYNKMQNSINSYFLKTPELFTDRFGENIYKEVLKNAKNYFIKKSIFGYDGGGRENEKQRIEDEQIFAGDYYIKYELEKLINKFGVKSIVETGTAEGKSTLEMSSMVNNVYTIEINEKSYNVAQERLNKSKNIKMYLGNSPEVLRSIIEEIEYPALFYLDAHWFDYWPILDELKVISQSKNANECLIFIHDFAVPNKSFGYDIYKNQPLDINYVKEKLYEINKSFKYYYNKKALGKKRGVLYAHPAEVSIIQEPLVHIIAINERSNNYGNNTERYFTSQNYKNIYVNSVIENDPEACNKILLEIESDFVFFSRKNNCYNGKIINNCIELFRDNPNLDLVFIGNDDEKIIEVNKISDLLLITCMCRNDFIIRRHIFEEIGLFDELKNEMYELFLRFVLSNRYNVGILYDHYKSSKSVIDDEITAILNEFVAENPIDLIFQKFDWLKEPSRSLAEAYFELGLCFVELNDYIEGIKYFGMSFKTNNDIEKLITVTNKYLFMGKVKELVLLIQTIKGDLKNEEVIIEIEELLNNYISIHK